MKLNLSCSLAVASIAMLSVFARGEDASWEAMRKAAINRQRVVIYNTDGCDALYYPNERPVTAEDFQNLRLAYSQGTEVDSIFYCPISSGFGNVTYRTDVGDRMLKSYEGNKEAYNVTGKLIEMGTDPLQLAVEYARKHNLEIFASMRFNDTHDAEHSAKKPYFLFPQFKYDHPAVLFGAEDRRPPNGAWSAVDFTEPLVQERMLGMIRELCENYDLDGIELDFMRHMQLLRSVSWGGMASQEELDSITGLVAKIRDTAEEVGHRRGRPILIAIRVPDSVDFARAVGIDLEAWLSRGLADLMITTSYFQLNPWRYSVALARKYGVKFYASLDESRINGNLPVGRRGGSEFFAARAMAALASGADGIYYFNMEYGGLQAMAFGKWETLAYKDKVYYATERGSGGYRPWHYLKNGMRFNNMPRMEPGDVAILPAGGAYKFEITIGDCLKLPETLSRKPVVMAALRADGVEDDLMLCVNGITFKPVARKDGIQTYNLPPYIINSGSNEFIVTDSAPNAGDIKLQDFAVAINYRRQPVATVQDAASSRMLPCAVISILDGKPICTGGFSGHYLKNGIEPEGSSALKLLHSDAIDGYQLFQLADAEVLNNPPEMLIAEWTAQALEDGPNGQPAYSCVIAPARSAGSSDVWEFTLRCSTRDIVTSLGTLDADEFDPKAENTYRLVMDTRSGDASLWVNGQLATSGKITDGRGRKQPFLNFGDGSGSVAGVALFRGFAIGVPQR